MYGNLRVEEKDKEATKVLGLNIISMSFWQKKLQSGMAEFIFEKFGADTAGLHDVRIKWSDFKASQTLASLLWAKAENIRSVASHNKQETNKIGRYQRVDTAPIIIIRELLASSVIDSGVDHIGLGRWAWYQVEGDPRHRTYFIKAYAPCENTRVGEVTVYKQQERFIQEKGPGKMFCEDLLADLRR